MKNNVHRVMVLATVLVMGMTMGCDIFIGGSSDSTPPTFSIAPISAGTVSSMTIKVSKDVGLQKNRAELPNYFILEYANALELTTTITVKNVNFISNTFTLEFDPVTLTIGQAIRVTIKSGVVSDYSNNENAQTTIVVRVI